MKHLLAVTTFLLVAVCSLIWSCSAAREPTMAITHVTVIDATGAPPQQDMTVLIADRRIATLGPSGPTAIPRAARILDATGKFLIPGLAGMHVHLTGAGEPRGSREFIIPLLLANGVTTVRDMGGKVEYLGALRSEIEGGARLGPQIFFTGPYLDGDPPGYQPSTVVKSANDFPGWSLHEDIAYLVEAGLTPMQALQAARKNPAEFLGKLQAQGTVVQGKLADLLLLDDSPLEDIHNTQKIRALILHGKFLDRTALDEILASEAKFAATH
jgi:predicted amidohydrolase